MTSNGRGGKLSGAMLDRIEAAVRRRYREFSSGLPFHGWHHVEFVRAKAVALALKNGADVSIVEAAALLHDLNYMVQRNSRVTAARALRAELLTELGLAPQLTRQIEEVIAQAETE
ncbi:MAG: HD family phosphohydrolase, partial [Pyrinomonadaceae bacterium]